MSGTSFDGIDAAAVRVSGGGDTLRVRLLNHITSPYSRAVREALSSPEALTARDVCRLNALVGEAFARAALKCADGAGLPLSRFDAVASHGQTLWHIPPSGRRPGSTLQVGEPAVIARRTGLPVVSGFRAADMAEGGQGAPLVPYADYLLFKKKAPVAVHNLGGISNVTLVAPKIDDVRAFDTGPGNSLIDAAMRKLFGKPYDRGGATARRGRPDRRLLAGLMRHPYLKRRPPKSTGTDTFGPAMVEDILSGRPRMKAEALVSTLAHFTAASVADAYRRFLPASGGIREAVFSGGGTRNTFLMELLAERLIPVKVAYSDDHGIPSGAKEALCFAVLGAERLAGNRTNLPRVTGAGAGVGLGSVTMP
jgi:anhydro-N-acetylmuramic acid kinase